MTSMMKILRAKAFGTLCLCRLGMVQGVELTGNQFNSNELTVVLSLVRDIHGGPSASGKNYVDTKFEVTLSCKFIP